MPLKWRKVLIADERYESCGVFDVDNDGVLDIVSGAYWYKGPDFKKAHKIGDPKAVGEYYDDFSTIPMDIDGDGYLDYITGGFWGNSLRWWQNPGKTGGPWKEHTLAEVSNVETTRAWDIDGDGELEIVPNLPCTGLSIFKLERDANGKPAGKFTRADISDKPQGHGLGCGDIAGNGRMDLILGKGWWECPKKPMTETWTFHDDWSSRGDSSVPMLVEDINGDGLNEIIVGGAHSYGLDWYQQQKDSSGKRTWIKHPIDPFNSQYHDLQWAWISTVMASLELITGKLPPRAHCGNDVGEPRRPRHLLFQMDGRELRQTDHRLWPDPAGHRLRNLLSVG